MPKPIRRAVACCVLLGLAAIFPVTVLASDAMPSGWPGAHLQAAFLGLLAPLALVLLAVGATPPDEASEVVATALGALAVGIVGYVACGFAFQFGGLGLRVAWPGVAGLVAEWSPLDPTLGLGWGAIGLQGFFLSGAAATPDAYALAAAQLPAVAVAVLIPTLALARRANRAALLGVAATMGGLLFPIVGNWVWGGGWLALLGATALWTWGDRRHCTSWARARRSPVSSSSGARRLQLAPPRCHQPTSRCSCSLVRSWRPWAGWAW